eukprot:7622370-Pyramimonas_sp.AAC.1
MYAGAVVYTLAVVHASVVVYTAAGGQIATYIRAARVVVACRSSRRACGRGCDAGATRRGGGVLSYPAPAPPP